MSYSPDLAVVLACALALASFFLLWALPAAFVALAKRLCTPTTKPSAAPPIPPATNVKSVNVKSAVRSSAFPRIQHAG